MFPRSPYRFQESICSLNSVIFPGLLMLAFPRITEYTGFSMISVPFTFPRIYQFPGLYHQVTSERPVSSGPPTFPGLLIFLRTPLFPRSYVTKAPHISRTSSCSKSVQFFQPAQCSKNLLWFPTPRVSYIPKTPAFPGHHCGLQEPICSQNFIDIDNIYRISDIPRTPYDSKVSNGDLHPLYFQTRNVPRNPYNPRIPYKKALCFYKVP